MSSPQEQATQLRTWFVRGILRWFRTHQRNLPWRIDRDPYRIWVSEVMLQQTTVATVVPAFERFVERFPTLADLAEAEEQEVLRLWEGLGYYRRARSLHEASRLVVQNHAGVLPRDPALVRGLPGFGEYTTNAVLSQAYDLRLPILEANSQRVLSRLFARRDDPAKTAARKWLWEAAEGLLPRKNVGDVNQAIMELGALVCTPTAPKCDDCPLRSRCEAYRLGEQETIPEKAPKPDIVRVEEVAVVIRKRDKFLLVQRPQSGRWSMMWEFPHGQRHDDETEEEATPRLASELTGIRVGDNREVTTLRHSVTHHRIRLVCREAEFESGRFRSDFYQQGRWVSSDELADFPVSSPQRRLIGTLTQEGRQRRLF